MSTSSNAFQLQRRNRELSILNTFAQALNRSLDLGEILRVALAQVAELLDLETGWKVDLIVRRDRPFSVQEFERRKEIDFFGIRLAVATVEDLILAKLEWATEGSSQRQIEDVAGVLRVRFQEMDLEYVEDWVSRLKLEDAWDQARREAGIE